MISRLKIKRLKTKQAPVSDSKGVIYCHPHIALPTSLIALCVCTRHLNYTSKSNDGLTIGGDLIGDRYKTANFVIYAKFWQFWLNIKRFDQIMTLNSHLTKM